MNSLKRFYRAAVSHLSLLISTNVLAVMLLLVLVEACALSVVYATYRNRVLFSELEQLRHRAEDMQTTWTQLLLEQSTLLSFQRVVERAHEDLQMKVPDPNTVVVLQPQPQWQ